MAETYKYYPHGDKDFTGPQRHDVQVIKREGSAWSYLGSETGSRIPEDEMTKIRKNVEAGFGKLVKFNPVGQIIEGGRVDLMEWTEKLEGGNR